MITFPRDFKPSTLAEAILFANHWYHDSGFHAYIEGWVAGDGRPVPAVTSFTPDLIKWAESEVNLPTDLDA